MRGPALYGISGFERLPTPDLLLNQTGSSTPESPGTFLQLAMALPDGSATANCLCEAT